MTRSAPTLFGPSLDFYTRLRCQGRLELLSTLHLLAKTPAARARISAEMDRPARMLMAARVQEIES